MVTVD